MKEYLVKTDSGSYLYTKNVSDIAAERVVEVPEGAEIAVKFKNDIDEHGVVFYKNNGKSSFSEKTKFWEHDSNWIMRELLDENHFYGDIDLSHRILWQRHTQPEELPFVDSLPEFKHDFVNHPKHYCDHPSGIECIEITRHHDFTIGNAIKYLWRAGLKDSDNEIQDLKKAVWYIQDKIAQLENK